MAWGKKIRVLVFAKGEKEKEGVEAGADFVGSEDIIEKIKEFKTWMMDRDPWTKGSPKSVNNLTNHTINWEKTGKCGVGHAMAAINYNYLRRMNGDNYSMKIVDGMKIVVCTLKSNPLNMTSIAYPTDEIKIT
jgi:hypothetical protein